MSLLFDTPLIAGLAYAENVISEAEERQLLQRLDALELAPFRFHGWLGNRKTQSFGWRYDFEDASFTPAEPIPGWLQPLRERAASFAGVAPEDFVHVLLARYDAGAGIGWHRDRDVFEKVVGISLAMPATLRFRRRIAEGFTRAGRVSVLFHHFPLAVRKGPPHRRTAALTGPASKSLDSCDL